MNFSYGMKSLTLFVLSVISLIALTLFEFSLAGMTVSAERIISFLLLVLPGIIGIVFGILGIIRKESRIWIAYLGILLNVLFASFHALVLSFAG